MNENDLKPDDGGRHPLADELGRLPSEVEPARDLWPAIATRLEERPQPWWRRVLPQVVLPANPWPALAALGALALVGAMLWPRPIEPPVGLPTAGRQASLGAIVPTAELVDTAHAEDGLLQLRRDLLESLERRRHKLSPESIAILEEALAVMDQAIGEVRLALETDPGNVRLNRRLAAQYQREVDLLIALNRI